ncbi:MAG TPA: hypothetical protein VGD31_02620 [Sphingobacteriaceae bacterium]
MTTTSIITFPANPLDYLHVRGGEKEYHRRVIAGILDSYHGNYDVLSEAVQNAVDALEDAFLLGLSGPFVVEVTINLTSNWIGILDTGIGMSPEQVASSFAPNVSFKNDPTLLEKRGKKASYRGYKGVGLTFLSYGSDDVIIHTKQENHPATKGRMQYGRAWALGERNEDAVIVQDDTPSPLDNYQRGTYIQIGLSQRTRPKSLKHISPSHRVWETILRTRTAIGQILLGQSELLRFKCNLRVIDTNNIIHNIEVEPTFVFPHMVERKPPFRFLDVREYWSKYGNRTDIGTEHIRQDGIYLVWETEEIRKQLSEDNREKFGSELDLYAPILYAFLPYQTSIWRDINHSITGQESRNHLSNGLVIAINRQRLAEYFEIEPTRFENLSLNMFVLVHFDNAHPDQGRKTVQDEVFDLARKAADRAVQYMAVQRKFLRPAGEAPTPGLREVEKDHEDWIFNVRTHARQNPIHMPPVSYQSIPLTEQDVVGLFHQLSALGVFPGIEVFATSQSNTYDCLVRFNCPNDTRGLIYTSQDQSPLGISKYLLGTSHNFTTKHLTLEFKNNLDRLIDDVQNPSSNKSFSHIDICVCWSIVNTSFRGYTLEVITDANIEDRRYPGVTHLLRRDGDGHVVQVIMLTTIREIIESGQLLLK